MHFIITGGAGFIGSHLTDTLLAENHTVTVVDFQEAIDLGNLPKHAKLQLVAKDINACTASDFGKDIDGIAHLAAVASVQESWDAPKRCHDYTLTSTVSVLELAKALGCKKTVFASSAAVYGNPKSIPVSEQDLKHPTSPYGLHKKVSEDYFNFYAKQYDLNAYCLRFFNVYGPRQRPDSIYSGVITKFIDNLKNNRPLSIFGDGNQTRDFIYVKDLVQALTSALFKDLGPPHTSMINLGNGLTTSILELAKLTQSFFPDAPKEIHFLDPREGDILESQANIEAAKHQLQFTPQYPLSEGLELLINSLE